MRSYTFKFSLGIVLSALLLSACGPSTVSQLTKTTGASRLTAEEILLMAKGNTLSVQGHQVNSYLYFDASGDIFGLDIYNNKDAGRWDVSEEGELCFKMDEWWLGKLRCFPVYHDGRKYYLFNSSEVLELTADHLEGDRKNLYFVRKKSSKSFLSTVSEEKAVGNSPSTATAEQPGEISAGNASAGAPSDEEMKATVQGVARDCPGCNLVGANLAGADLIGAKLQGANLSGANLGKANLRRADLREADLRNADLSYANMPGADLRGSDLTNAVFKGANLIRANFTGAITAGANFDGALLEGAEGLP